MKIETSELTGAALDWAVTSIENPDALRYGLEDWMEMRRSVVKHGEYVYRWNQSWAQGGPIIEREGITVSKEEGCWSAYFRDNLFEDDGSEHWQTGPTPLIAAMRCYVASKLGYEIEVPEELK